MYPVASNKGEVKVYLQQVFTGKKRRGKDKPERLDNLIMIMY